MSAYALGNLIPAAYAQTAAVVNAAAKAKTQATATASQVDLSGTVGFIWEHLDNWILGVAVVVISYLLSKTAASALREALVKKKGEEIQESLLVLIERMTKIAVVAIGITIAFAINGINFSAIIGAISLGIGFGLKDIVANFISSVVLLVQNRIHIGDFIQVNGILGTIVGIDTRVTVLQALDGTEVVIPNQIMLNQTITSYSSNPFRRVELVVGVDYKSDLPTVTNLIAGVIEKDPDIVPKPAPMVLVDEFGSSSINIRVYFWIEITKNWMVVRSNLAYRIKKAFDELGINIPFPIRTLKLDEDDRAFLKTMDSLKKGYVPEVKKMNQNAEAIQIAAEHTKNAPHLPENVFHTTAAEKKEELTPASAMNIPIAKKEDDDHSPPSPHL